MVIDMSTKLKIREALTRFTQAVIGLDGFLHIAEVVSAYREQAWVTFALTSLHTAVFFLAVYLVGHDHTHHKHEHEHDESDNEGIGKKVVIIVALVLLGLALTPVAGELLHLGHDH